MEGFDIFKEGEVEEGEVEEGEEGEEGEVEVKEDKGESVPIWKLFCVDSVATLAKLNIYALYQRMPIGWECIGINREKSSSVYHFKDSNEKIRIRIDLAHKNGKPPYTHIHIYDEDGKLLDGSGKAVEDKDEAGHIEYLGLY